MNIKINGKCETIDGVGSLSDLVDKRRLCPEHIVIEHNNRIAPKEEWRKIVIKDNDSIEIVSFVGGG